MDFIELRTVENSTVYFHKAAIAAIEDVPQTGRTEAFVRVYSAGYKFNIKGIESEELLRLLKAQITSHPAP